MSCYEKEYMFFSIPILYCVIQKALYHNDDHICEKQVIILIIACRNN